MAVPQVETVRGILAEEVGFEPTRAGSQPLTVFKTGRISRSRILPKLVEKVGIEPTTIRLQGGRSPKLSYIPKLVGIQGFEPWTLASQTRCAAGLRYTPKLGADSMDSNPRPAPYRGAALPLSYTG